jgi:hypothetical protein
VSALAAAVVLSAALAWSAPAAAAADPAEVGWRVTWWATRQDGAQTVRVKVVFTNGSSTRRYEGVCRVRVWNADDAVRQELPIRLRPGGSAEIRFRVILEGTSPVRANVTSCAP